MNPLQLITPATFAIVFGSCLYIFGAYISAKCNGRQLSRSIIGNIILADIGIIMVLLIIALALVQMAASTQITDNICWLIALSECLAAYVIGIVAEMKLK